jgi:uncharacterized protein (TIGR03435 family)
MRIRAGVAGVLLFTLGRAQTVEPAFAAASIRPAQNVRSTTFGSVEFKPGGRLIAVAANVRQLVNAAYGLTGSWRVRLGPRCPAWIDSERFDVEAVVEEGAIPERLDNAQLREKMQPLLQRLLAERFNLVIRREPKELPVYKLTVAKPGAKLTESPISEAECRTSSDCHRLLGNRMQGLRGTAVSIADLAFALETGADRPVVDATGIPGLFAMQVAPFATLKLYLDDFLDSLPAGVPRPPPEPYKPSLSSVLEKDFGLLFLPARAQIEITQIESVSRPSSN